MDNDPWFWDAEDIQRFFREDAANYICDRPTTKLPPVGAFVQTLSKLGVDGASLLGDVDMATLRDEFNIANFSQRGAVMHCIRKLRKQSRTYACQRELPKAQALPSRSPTLVASESTPLAAPVAVGEHLRPGEVQVQGEGGRKRRKLMPTLQAPAQAAIKDTSQSNFYLPTAACTLDELFYGQTALGQEVEALPVPGNLLVEADDGDIQEDNFQFTSQHKSRGEAEYVQSRLRYLHYNAEEIVLQRRGYDAIALLPYPERLLRAKPRSATVFQMTDDNDVVAIREKAALLHSGHDQPGLDRQSNGEWDYLIQKYGNGDGEELPTYGESEYSGDGSTTLAAEIEDDERDVAERADCVLTNACILQTIDNFINDCVANWLENLPELDKKKAWTVWKQTKRSRTVREELIVGARSLIEKFTARLAKIKERLMEGEWKNERELLLACVALEPTVEDREEAKWKISVWQRRKEPGRIILARGTNGANPFDKAPHVPAVVESSGFKIHPNDRMSVSPTPAIRIEGAPAVVQEGDHFYTPEGTTNNPPDESKQTDGERFVVEDETLPSPRSKQSVGSDAGGDGFEASDEMAVDLVDRDNPPSHSEPEKSSSPSPSNGPADSERGSDIKPEDDKVGSHRSKSVKTHSEDDGRADSGDELPSPSTLVRAFVKPQSHETPRRLDSLPQNTQPIDLTMTSDSEPSPLKRLLARSAKKGRPNESLIKKAATLRDDPQNATNAEVASWDVRGCAKTNDRMRLLIMLLDEAGPRYRNDLHEFWIERGPEEFTRQLRAALRTRQSGVSLEEDVTQNVSEMMIKCAEFAATWHIPSVLLTNAEPDWSLLLQDDRQILMFVHMLVAILAKKDTKLFKSPKKHSTQPVVILSSDDESANDTPRKKRKRPVNADQAAVRRRNNALDRQNLYQQKLIGASSDASQLGAMVGTDPSNSEIVINPIKGDDQEFIYIHPSIAKRIKAHQIDGVRFMWREITAVGDEGSQGCILAHTMGLGKTMQVITLLVAVEEAARSKRSSVKNQLPRSLRPRDLRRNDGLRKRTLRKLILCPPSLLQNWRREIDEWAGDLLGAVHIVESGKDYKDPLQSWSVFGGILLIGYPLFRGLLDRGRKIRKMEWIEHTLLEEPELVIADEAHNLRNEKSQVAVAASGIVTHTRIGLTGTPMSNDVQEIYALVSFVAPGYLGDPIEFRATYAEPIARGTWQDSSPGEVRQSIKKLAVLRHQIEPKVNRADITVLKGSLKPKVEFVITVPLTETQETIYKETLAALLGDGRNKDVGQMTMFGWLAVLSLLNTHPVAFKRKLLTRVKSTKKKRKSGAPDGIDSDHFPGAGDADRTAPPSETETEVTTLEQLQDANNSNADEILEKDVFALGFTEAMVHELVDKVADDLDPLRSAKTSVFVNVLRLSKECGDKVLVFSMSLATLDYLVKLLDSLEIPFGRIDGLTPIPKRMKALEDFHGDRFDVMLISTRAGGVGLNIQGANRVVIFDFGFNPTWEEQAIGRAYRLGQQKPVFVYRFVAGGTFEREIYNKQLFKSSLAQRVVDQKNPRRNAQRTTRSYFYPPKEIEQEDLSGWIGKDPMVIDRILAKHGTAAVGGGDTIDTKIRIIRTMETLQEDAKDEPLNEEERKEVDMEIHLGRVKGRGRRAAAPANLMGSSLAASQSASIMTQHIFSHAPAPLPVSMPARGVDPSASSDSDTFLGGLPSGRPLFPHAHP